MFGTSIYFTYLLVRSYLSLSVCKVSTLEVEYWHYLFFLLQNFYASWHLGGVHAAMVGSLHPTPVATLPFLSPHSAVVAFCEGILKHGTAWEALREELAAKKVAMTLEEVRERMRNVLSLTDVTRFPIPKIPNAVIFVAATVSTVFDYHHEDVLKMDSQHFFALFFLSFSLI